MRYDVIENWTIVATFDSLEAAMQYVYDTYGPDVPDDGDITIEPSE